jgi:hypothetical protein
MRNRAATALIVVFMAAGLYTGFGRHEIYPFSTFPMYSSARADPDRPERYGVVGLTAEGRVTDAVVTPLGSSMFVHWVEDAEGDPERLDRLGDLFLEYNRRRTPELELEGIRITRTTYEIPPYPSRDPPRKAEVEVLYETRQ